MLGRELSFNGSSEIEHTRPEFPEQELGAFSPTESAFQGCGEREVVAGSMCFYRLFSGCVVSQHHLKGNLEQILPRVVSLTRRISHQ